MSKMHITNNMITKAVEVLIRAYYRLPNELAVSELAQVIYTTHVSLKLLMCESLYSHLSPRDDISLTINLNNIPEYDSGQTG